MNFDLARSHVSHECKHCSSIIYSMQHWYWADAERAGSEVQKKDTRVNHKSPIFLCWTTQLLTSGVFIAEQPGTGSQRMISAVHT